MVELIRGGPKEYNLRKHRSFLPAALSFFTQFDVLEGPSISVFRQFLEKLPFVDSTEKALPRLALWPLENCVFARSLKRERMIKPTCATAMLKLTISLTLLLVSSIPLKSQKAPKWQKQKSTNGKDFEKRRKNNCLSRIPLEDLFKI